MSQAFTPGLQVRNNYLLTKVRELLVPGEILVKEGQIVNAQDVVAKADLPGDMIIVRIAEQLGVEAAETVEGLKVKVGDQVTLGQLLCEHAGLFGLSKSRFFSPYSGTVEFITEKIGHFGLRLPSRGIELRAYITGKVSSVSAKKSVTIESNCAFVQGIFGVGGERFGKLKALSLPVDCEIDTKHIPDNVKDCVIFGGSRANISALKKAAELGAVGIVTGSIDDQTLAEYLGYDLGLALTGKENVPMTLIITEGFGNLPMSPLTFQLLSNYGGKDVSINGATQVRAGALRPEVIISHSAEVTVDAKVKSPDFSLNVGQAIRIIRVPYFGMAATVVELPHEVQEIESGARARVLKAKLQDGRVVTVPRANIELVSS